ncbi:acyltransferase [Butyrivibrio sp. TB]|uniref:acyltransferase n=1 Tax=Butyrivibrio sp. TB TaxID=1520809 RepID=UPI0008BCDC49|nr:acyltransferase [Butyrivibrio sp. TB]SEP96988.1 Surface polysaccharide O-acyltransferase, integral membrane enzyme [Butyrivibrio sp. TB]
MTTRKRDANFEILRVIAILMVLTLHYLSHTDLLLKTGEKATNLQLVGQFIESFCIVAVNVWVLISGYFLSKSDFKLTRILQLIAEVYFYTLLVTFAMQVVNTANVARTDRIFKTTQFLFPISSEHYSFATAYILLYVIAPILNKGVLYLTRKQLKASIIGLLIMFCLIKSIIPVNFPTDMMGYNLDWYICLYLIAAYIRKYNVRIVNSPKTSVLLYVGASVLSFAVAVFFHELNYKTGRFIYYSGVTFHYNFILCLIGALGLFSTFRYIKVKEGYVAKFARLLAPFSFGIYLLHEHLEIRDRWVEWMKGIYGNVPATIPGMAGHLISCILTLFVSCVFVDWIRSVIFEFVERVCVNTKFWKKLMDIDKELKADEK